MSPRPVTSAAGRERTAAFDLSGQSILVTGAAGSIGAATARLCAAMGARLVLTDLKEPVELARELEGAGAAVTTHAADVADRQAMERLVSKAGDLGAIVANAGYCPWDDWHADGWDDTFARVMDVNVLGVFHLVRAGVPAMQARGGGRIVIVSSTAGRMGGVAASPHYVAAKGGLLSFIKWAARKYAPHGVLVNGVAPGPTRSNMTRDQSFDPAAIPLGRMAEPEEIAGPIAFLCSPASSFVCGAVLDVNGGIFMN